MKIILNKAEEKLLTNSYLEENALENHKVKHNSLKKRNLSQVLMGKCLQVVNKTPYTLRTKGFSGTSNRVFSLSHIENPFWVSEKPYS